MKIKRFIQLKLPCWKAGSNLSIEFREKFNKDGVFLNLGCGLYSERVRQSYNPRVYIGLDLDIGAKPTIVGDVRKIPLKDKSIDTILCVSLLEHVFEYGEVLDEIKRVIKNDGIVEIQVPFLWFYHAYPNDYFRFSHSALEKLFREKGFRVAVDYKYTSGFFMVSSKIFEDGSHRFNNLFLKYILRCISIILMKLRFLDKYIIENEDVCIYNSVTILAIYKDRDRY